MGVNLKDYLIMSIEKNILHLIVDDNKVIYSLYDKSYSLVDGGEIEQNENEDISLSIKELIDLISVHYEFSEPYEKLPFDFLKDIEEKEFSNMQKRIENSFDLQEEIEK